jgi:hypothetical protein
MILKQVQLHTPLFLGRTNLSEKLDSQARSGLRLEYKKDEGLVYVTFNGETGLIPVSAVSCMIAEAEPQTIARTPINLNINRPAIKTEITAQVSTPTSHVFEPGQGKS